MPTKQELSEAAQKGNNDGQASRNADWDPSHAIFGNPNYNPPSGNDDLKDTYNDHYTKAKG